MLEALSIGVPVVLLDCSSKTGGGLKDFLNGRDELTFLRIVEPVWSQEPIQDEFEGSLCHFDYEKTALRLAQVVLDLIKITTEDRTAWFRRHQQASKIRSAFSAQVFAESWLEVLG
jgi:hypothetical protein